MGKEMAKVLTTIKMVINFQENGKMIANLSVAINLKMEINSKEDLKKIN